MLGIKVMLMVAAGDPRRTWPGAGGGHTRRYIYRKTGCGGGFLRRVSSGPRHVGVLWDFGDVQVCVWHPASSWCRWFPTGAPRGPEGRPWPCLPPIQIDATLQGSHVVCGGLPLSDCNVVSRNRRSCCEVNRVSRSRCGRILVEVKTRAMPGDLVILTSAMPSTCEFGRPVTDTQTTTTHRETAPLVMAGTLMAEQCRPRMIGILMEKLQRWPLGTRTDDSCAQPWNPQPTGCDRVLTWRRGVPSQ